VLDEIVMVTGAVLASGRSSRMGRSKALLRLGPSGPTFVQALVETLGAAGLRRVLVVGRPDDQPLRAQVEAIGAVFVENAQADQGQLSSILAALDRVASAHAGLLVTPVDLPLVTSDTLRRLCTAAARAPDRIVRPVFAGRHGHPVIFPRAVFPALRAADPHVGARAVVRAASPPPLDVAVGDSGVVDDVDTPADYRRLIDPAGPGA
jgi:molybdenum cofactor cytidylyltransferase